MTVEKLAKLVQEMRAAQKQYFRLRSTDALEQSKRLERIVDISVKDVLENQQMQLFSGSEDDK